MIRLCIMLLLLNIFYLTHFVSATEIKLIANDGNNDDKFGYSIDVDNNYAIVGAPYHDEKGSNAGCAYVFIKENERWIFHKKLTASDTSANDYFGYCVSISDTYAAVGAYRDGNKGAVYIYKLDGKWNQEKITASDGRQNDDFGYAIDVSSDSLVVGAPRYDFQQDHNYNFDSGAVYIYKFNNNWEESRSFKPSVNQHTRAGQAVSIFSNSIFIGSPLHSLVNTSNRCGYVFHYILENGNWRQKKLFTKNANLTNHYFGGDVALSDNYAVVTASSHTYVYHKNQNNNWYLQSEINEPAIKSNYPAAIYGDYITLGSSQDVYILKRYEQQWHVYNRLLPYDGIEGESFGNAIAMYQNEVWVGAPYQNNEKGKSAGAVYIYNIDKLQPQFSISGYVYDEKHNPITGVTLNFENGGKSTTTNIDGFFSHNIFYGWTGNIIPSKGDFQFMPEKIHLHNVRSDFSNVIFNRKQYTISGYINDSNDKPIIGVEILLSNNGGSTNTNRFGFYSHEVHHGWSGIALPHKKGYKFTPLAIPYSEEINENKMEQNYIGQQYSISGSIIDDKNTLISDVKLEFNNGGGSTITNEQGVYIKDLGYLWSGTITPKLIGYSFHPQSYTFNQIKINHIDINFQAIKKTYEISGRIIDNSNQPIKEVKVYFGNTYTITNNDGIFLHHITYKWNGNITPEKSGFIFQPSSIELKYKDLLEDEINIDFIALNKNYFINELEQEILLKNQEINQQKIIISEKLGIITDLNNTISSMYSKEELDESIDLYLKAEIMKYSSYRRYLDPGWHLISAVNAKVKPKVIPGGAIESIYMYRKGTYVPVNELIKGYGFWVYAKEKCEIIVDAFGTE